MLRFNNDVCELSFQHTTNTQTLSMLTHNKWQKSLERVRMKTDKAITGSVITCHYTVLAICITRWVIKGSNTDWYCSEKQSQQFRKTNDHYQIFPKIIISCVKKKSNVYYDFCSIYQTRYFWLSAFLIIHIPSPPHYPRQSGLYYKPEIISGNSNNFYNNKENTRRANYL